jgi:chromosome condensin MukBEF ATPase and DNA-binding subunit MukB
MKERYILTAPVKGGTCWWNVADTESPIMQNFAVASFAESMPDAFREARQLCDRLNKKIGEPERDLAMVEVRALFHRINRKLNEFKEEVRTKMQTETALDQAVDGLTTAATNKLAEDQVLDTLANDEAAETTKVQAITESLNAETAAEQAALTPAAAAAAATTAVEPAASTTEAAATTTGS